MEMNPTTKPDAATITPTGETRTGGEAPVPKIEELDRLRLKDVYGDLVSIKNSLTAIQATDQKLDAEKRNMQLMAEAQAAQGEQLQAEMQRRLEEVREKYNIPDGYTIDVKTGIVSSPDAPQQAGGPALVQPTETADGVSTVKTVPAGTV